MNQGEYGLLEQFLENLAEELRVFLPKIFIGIIIILALFLFIRIIGTAVKRLLSFADIDGLIKRHTGIELPLPFNTIVMVLLYVGAVLAAVYALINIFFGREYVALASSLTLYGARVISVVVMALVLFTAFSAIIERIRVESRLRGYLFFIVMLLLTAMLIDITALSDPVKHALYAGLSIGIGASLAVFAVWFFFQDYFEKLIKKGES